MANNNNKTKKTAQFIALPALLVISLLAARLVMNTKTGLKMTGPVELNRLGLSVHMPSGNLWKSDEKWNYENNSFVIKSFYNIAAVLNKPYAQCRYLFAANPIPPRQRLEEIPSETKIETGQITSNNLVINWAIVNTSGIQIILGVCDLSAGRQIEIEVMQTSDESELAREIFEKIAKSIEFNDNGLLETGIKFITRLKDGELINSLDFNSRPSSIFNITDSHSRSIGFMLDTIAALKTDSNTVINAAEYYYLKSPSPQEQVSYFSGSPDLTQFKWQIENDSRTGKKGTEIIADGSGIVSIRRLRTGSIFERRIGKAADQTVLLSKIALPEDILDTALVKFLDIDEKNMVIDVIRSDGDIIPAYIEKLPAENPDISSIKFEWLNENSYWQQNFYDNSNKIVKIVLSLEGVYNLNRSDVNEIARLFPERSSWLNKFTAHEEVSD